MNTRERSTRRRSSTISDSAASGRAPSATPDFAGMVQWVINFMTDTDPNSWSIGDGDQRGYGFNYLEYEAADAAIPNTPPIALFRRRRLSDR